MRVQLPLLSKTRYLYGVQCDKRLYLDCFSPETVGETSPSLQRRLEQGNEVGTLATRRYPGGLRIEYDRKNYEAAAATTARALMARSVPAIFEAAFQHAGVRIRADILVRKPGGWWRLEEVKSSSQVKPEHLHDLAVQLFVLEACGIRIGEAGILHLNRDYVLTRKALDVHALFTFADLRKEARETRRMIASNLRRWRRQLAAGNPPDVEPGRQCSAPYECPFTAECIPPLGRFSLRRLPRHEALIDAVGGRAPDDIRRVPADVRITPMQARAIGCIKTGEEFVSPDLRDELDDVVYPIHFLDFETFAPAVPRYRGTHVYQTLPFQWSDYVLSADGRLEHREYLHTSDTDPRRGFIESLLEALGGHGTIVVYTNFEKTQLEGIAGAYPEFRKPIRKVIARLFDLYAVVKAHYYHPDLDGSFSLKDLVPVVLPRLAYGSIAAGTDASAAYEEMICANTEPAQRSILERELRRYCRTDTVAMVKLWQTLRRRRARRETMSAG